MSYTKNIWKSGDTVTSAKLNNMEDGIAAAASGVGGIVVEMTYEKAGLDDVYYISDMDADDIKNAFIAGISVLLHFNYSSTAVAQGYANGEFYLSMVGYRVANDIYGESFDVDAGNNCAFNYNSFNIPTFGETSVTDDGKLKVSIYTD